MLDYQQAIASAVRPITSSLDLPAFDVSRSIAAMLEHNRPKFEFADAITKATADWQRVFQAVDAANLRRWMPVENHFTKLYELSAVARLSLQTINLGDIGLKLGLDDTARMSLASLHVKFGEEYRAFFKAVTENETHIVEIPQALTELPAVDYTGYNKLLLPRTSGRACDGARQCCQHRERIADVRVRSAQGRH
jgi:hypothetical protein